MHKNCLDELREFIDDLNDGLYDNVAGSYIAENFGELLAELMRELEDTDDEDPLDLVDYLHRGR